SHVRFTPNSGHVRRNVGCPLCANSGHSPIVGSTGRSPKMRNGEPPLATRCRLKFVAVEKATNSETQF
ncbi:MAG: hypothetical protein WB463_13765, partial [Pseudolabrys sp.]